MNRFFDFPKALWDYFEQVDQRFSIESDPKIEPAAVAWGASSNLGTVRAVLWDVYGTLCGLSVGDLEQSLVKTDELAQAAAALIEEFGLAEVLGRLYGDTEPAAGLREHYLQGIADSHLRSLAEGIEYPEVIIEKIWERILKECLAAGYEAPVKEPTLHTAYRWGYFFDSVLQRTFLYPSVAQALAALRDAGIVQGIISNAQFYTPLHLRRHLRRAYNDPDFELGDIFTRELVLFSYELGYSKPNRRGFVKAIDSLTRQGILREEILYVGNDMLNDVWAALRSGIRAAFYAGDATQATFRPEDQRCLGLKANAVLTDMKQLGELILGR